MVIQITGFLKGKDMHKLQFVSFINIENLNLLKRHLGETRLSPIKILNPIAKGKNSRKYLNLFSS